MKINKALKIKNRLIGQLNSLQEILRRENSRRGDNPSTVDAAAVNSQILDVTAKLSAVKSAIAVANVGIYAKIDKMSEIKNRIAFLRTLPTREGQEIESFGRDGQQIIYIWKTFLNQEAIDKMVADLQQGIDMLQDEVDTYNATTEVGIAE